MLKKWSMTILGVPNGINIIALKFEGQWFCSFFWVKDQIEDIFWDYPTFKENIEDNEDKEKNQQFKTFVNEILHQTSR